VPDDSVRAVVTTPEIGFGPGLNCADAGAARAAPTTAHASTRGARIRIGNAASYSREAAFPCKFHVSFAGSAYLLPWFAGTVTNTVLRVEFPETSVTRYVTV